MSGTEGGTEAFSPPRGSGVLYIHVGTQERGVVSMADYTAAKERARQHRLDRAIMARATHLKVAK